MSPKKRKQVATFTEGKGKKKQKFKVMKIIGKGGAPLRYVKPIKKRK